jgi:hypothetical protein
VLPPLTAPNRQQRVYVCVSRAARAAERHHAAHLIGLLIVVGIPEMEIGVAKPPRVSRKKPLKKRQRAGCAPFFRRRENKTSVRNLPGPRRVGQHAAAASTCPAPRSHVRAAPNATHPHAATPAPPPPPPAARSLATQQSPQYRPGAPAPFAVLRSRAPRPSYKTTHHLHHACYLKAQPAAAPPSPFLRETRYETT